MKDLFNSEQLEALRHHFPNISKAMEEGKDLLRTENQKLKAETKELKKELGKMKDLFNAEQLEALRHHFPNISM